jgi:hypothetical protein
MILVLGAWLSACAGSGPEGDGTPPPRCKPSEDPASVSFQGNLQPVFTASCALGGCHDAASSIQGLNLSVGASYGQLVNVRSTERRSLDRVQPGDPATSYLNQKIEDVEGISGTIMPPACGGGATTGTNGAPCLTADEVEMFRTWVLACAPNN